MIFKPLIKLIILLALFSILIGCEKSHYTIDHVLTARITAFDMNCSKCILEFPDDNLLVKELIGESPDNFYEAINLDKVGYEIGHINLHLPG